MSLCPCHSKPIVLNKDIVVSKYLFKTLSKKVWETPDQHIKICLPCTMIPSEKIDYKPYQKIGEGFIHAWLDAPSSPWEMPNDPGYYKYAVIPKGTEFFVDEKLTAIAAKKMCVMDRSVSMIDLCDTQLAIVQALQTFII